MSNEVQFSAVEEKQKRGFSIIWFIPLLAMFVGGWMVYQQWLNQGVNITIAFDNAEGLEAGKTKVKSRNVDIGLLTDVRFSEDRNRIIANVEIDKAMSDFLREDSQFWIVKPRIGAKGISGIGTILSGAYIELFPGKSERFKTEFTGLENLPVTPPNTPGLRLKLLAQEGAGLSIGDPVIYRGFNVGRIEQYEFDAKERKAQYVVFINAPYDSLVTTNSFFWNSGGISLSNSAQGLKVDVGTLETIISGGVQFDVPEDLSLGEPVKEEHRFVLYKNEKEVAEKRQYEHFEYLLLVDESVRGLYKDAPVEYRGIRIGRVSKPYLTPKEAEKLKVGFIKNNIEKIPVVIRIEPQRLIGQSNKEEIEAFNELFKQNLKMGLTASIDIANLLTGSLFISLDFNGSSNDKLEKLGPYIVIPSSKAGFAKIQQDIEGVLTKLNQLPLNELVTNTNNTINSADQTLKALQESIGQLNRILRRNSTQQLTGNLNRSLIEMQKTLKGLQPNSSAYIEMEKTMQKLQQTLDDLQPMIKKVSNNPSTLIFSTPRRSDLEPRRK